MRSQEEGTIFGTPSAPVTVMSGNAVVRDPTPLRQAITKHDANGIRFSRHPDRYPGFAIFEKADSWH